MSARIQAPWAWVVVRPGRVFAHSVRPLCRRAAAAPVHAASTSCLTGLILLSAGFARLPQLAGSSPVQATTISQLHGLVGVRGLANLDVAQLVREHGGIATRSPAWLGAHRLPVCPDLPTCPQIRHQLGALQAAICGPVRMKKGAKWLIHLAPLVFCRPLWSLKWWSRRESNPRPQAITGQFYMRS